MSDDMLDELCNLPAIILPTVDEALAALERAAKRYRQAAGPRDEALVRLDEATRRLSRALWTRLREPETEERDDAARKAAYARDAARLAAMPRAEMIRTAAREIPGRYAAAGCEGFVLTADELGDHLGLRGQPRLSDAEVAALWREGLLAGPSTDASRA